MSDSKPDNGEIAEQLRHIADLLDTQDANEYRVRAYRQGADTVENCDRSIAQMVDDEPEALHDLPHIGESLAGVIKEFVTTGRSSILERLESENAPADLLQRVPGIGEELAGRIVDELGVKTLEELENAAHDGRLGNVEGFGEERVQAVEDSLAGILSQSAHRRADQRQDEDNDSSQPSIDLLLDIDRTYRTRAEQGDLKKIAPRRFNPDNEAWLPIMKTERQDWTFTVLFSNTKRAHERDATHDWVVIYYERDGAENQCTVVTSNRGKLEGKRVVRGREEECRQHYDDE
jgi:hypothetical protein